MQPTPSFSWQHAFDKSRFRILFVDDELFAIKSVRKILERVGYVVYTATTYQDALDILANTHIHLGIFDLNLARQDEAPEDRVPKNFEGLDLASHPIFPHLRMVYTGQKDYEIVVESMKHPKAVNYIVKGDDSEQQLLQKVEAALAEHLALNQDLVFAWDNTSLQSIVQHIYPDLSLAEQLEHIVELEDLFRLQFVSMGQEIIQQITVQLLTNDKDHRSWLKVSAYSKRGRRFDSLVLCGERHLVLQEAEYFDQFSPRSNAMRTAPMQTVHYGMHLYEIFDNQLPQLETLSTLIKMGQYDFASAMIDKVHTDRFQQRQDSCEENGTLYQLALGREDGLLWETTEALFNIASQLSEAWQHNMPNHQLTLSPHEVSYVADKLPEQKYPNPVFYLETLGKLETKRPISMVHSNLRLSNIFAQSESSDFYLLDYADLTEASALRDYVTLETSIHTDIISQLDINDYQSLAHMLNSESGELSTESEKLQNTITLIHQIRQLALSETGCSLDHYLEDLYLDLLNYLLGYPQGIFVSFAAIKRYLHCFLLAGQICSDLAEMGTLVFVEQGNQDGLWLDAAENRLRVLGKSVKLTDNEFSLFEFLYENFEESCTYADIIQYGLKQELMHTDIDLERPRIHTAVSRLRPKLESVGFEISSWRNGYRLHHHNND